MKNVKIYHSDVNNPYFNLAIEDWLFRDTDLSMPALYLWRNDKVVVIGRHQNPWSECDLDAMEKDGVLLARRQSGGGAVFHDLGNTNFTFLASKNDYDKEKNFQIIIDALKAFGIEAEFSGRNDMLADGRKFSGSAFKNTSDKFFHHGTLLIRADMGALGRYLTPDETKLKAKGIKSVASRVVNLSELNPEITHEALAKAIEASFTSHYGAEAVTESLYFDEMSQHARLMEYYEHLQSWEWRFGKTPEFSHSLHKRFSWGNVEIFILFESGQIVQAKVYSDCLHSDMITALTEVLNGCRYEKKSLIDALEDLIEKGSWQDMLKEVQAWLSEEL